MNKPKTINQFVTKLVAATRDELLSWKFISMGPAEAYVEIYAADGIESEIQVAINRNDHVIILSITKGFERISVKLVDNDTDLTAYEHLRNMIDRYAKSKPLSAWFDVIPEPTGDEYEEDDYDV